MPSVSLVDRFLAKVRESDGCWHWEASKSRLGYARILVDGKVHLAHRVSFVLFIGEIPENKEIDHICGNRGCVNPSHLRVCDRSENTRNKKWFKGSSRLKGASWHKRYSKWHSQITVNYKNISLGYFDTKEEAHKAYCNAASELHGEFANYGDHHV